MTVSSMDQLHRWQMEWNSLEGAERTLHVRWLLTPDKAPLENALITEQHGQIVDIRSTSGRRCNVLPLVAIPPLVNAHTHLEFSALAVPLAPSNPFQEWIESLMQWRQHNNGSSNESISKGMHESIGGGVRLIGEITTQAELPHVQDRQLSIVAFHEAIGLRSERIAQQIHQIKEHLSTAAPAGVHHAISPHAPYTVHPDLLHELVSIAVDHAAPVAMHVAETTDEIELLSDGRGRFAEFLKRLGMFDASTFPGGRTVRQVLEQLSAAPKALAIHGNYFSDHDIAFLALHQNITTVYCPRTHYFFGHPTHPWRRLLSAGCRVILGTDSRASNPDLSIWKELQYVARLADDVSPDRLIAMVTTHAAQAMGHNPELFRVSVGSRFNPVLISFDESLSDLPQVLRHPATQPVSFDLTLD